MDPCCLLALYSRKAVIVHPLFYCITSSQVAIMMKTLLGHLTASETSAGPGRDEAFFLLLQYSFLAKTASFGHVHLQICREFVWNFGQEGMLPGDYQVSFSCLNKNLLQVGPSSVWVRQSALSKCLCLPRKMFIKNYICLSLALSQLSQQIDAEEFLS